MNSSVCRAALTALMFACPLGAQSMPERYEAADRYAAHYADQCIIADVRPVWIDGSERFWYLERQTQGHRFMLADPEKETVSDAFDHKDLAAKLAAETKRECRPDALPFDRIAFEGDAIRFDAEGKAWRYTPSSGTLETAAPPAREERPRHRDHHSPGGSLEAFIKDHNLHLRDTATGREWAVSEDGDARAPYRLPVHWSPDGKRLVCQRVTIVPERHITIVESAPGGSHIPHEASVAYPKPGDALPVTRPVLCGIEKGSARLIDFPGPEGQYHVGGVRWAKDGSHFTFYDNRRGHARYIVYRVEADSARIVDFPDPAGQYHVGGVRWSKDGNHFTFHDNRRGHARYIVNRVESDSPQAKPIITEISTTFIEYNKLFLHELADHPEMIWISERDGYRHLYLIHAATGEVIRQLTRGEWVVKRVVHVDEAKRELLAIGCGNTPGEDPYLEKLYRVPLDGGEPVCLTPENAWHDIHLSPNRRFCVDTMSRVDLPPVSVLRDLESGRIINTLKESDISPALAKGWRPPEVFSAKGRDGNTDIWGIIMPPAGAKGDAKAPVVEVIYAGPHDSHVPKRFSFCHEGSPLTELGFHVVMIDGMGTANRSKAFHDVCWKNLKDAGLPDHIAWLKEAADKHLGMDLERVGIYGCSAGGQSAMGALLFHPEFYKAGVAACGCHDNRVDKMWWNEQWMGYPLGKHYADNSNVTHAHKLQGRLMLILGETDSNVDPASTRQVVDALIKAGKDFEFVLLPGNGHTMGGPYGERKRRDFFVKHLMGLDPPNRNAAGGLGN